MANSSIKNLNIDGNVVISGSTTSIDVAQLTVDDINITLNDVGTPTDTNVSGGGLTLKGDTDHTWNWINLPNKRWLSSDHIDLATGKEYKINDTSVLSATTLGAGVVSSSLTDVGTLTALQVDTTVIDGNVIGLTTDTDLITLTNNTVTVAGDITATGTSPLGVITAREFVGGGTGITGISTTNINSPGVNGDFIVSSGATGWAGLTPPISIALGGTGAITAAAARTALGITATGADPAYTLVANNLSELTATSGTARTNLELGTTDSPSFGGEGEGFININATPSSGGTVAPTFSGTVFKSIPVASGSGHKWVQGIEQDGDLAFSYFTIDDAGANTSASETYLKFDPVGSKFVSVGSASIQVFLSALGYPTADGTANQVITTDGSAGLTFQTPVTTNITEGTNLYFTDARAIAALNWANLNNKTGASGPAAVGIGRDVNGLGANAVAIGDYAGETSQSQWAVALGEKAGSLQQGVEATALGRRAGSTQQKTKATAVGAWAGEVGQDNNTVAVGYQAGQTNQEDSAIAIGSEAGQTSQGENSIAIGKQAGEINQGDNSIVLSAIGSAFSPTTASALFIQPIRNVAGTTYLQYNNTTKEVTHIAPDTDSINEGSSNLYYTNARADARIVAAGSANWNTAYTDTNAATDASTNNTIVKRGATGNFSASKITADNGVVLGNAPVPAAGTVQWTGTDFQGYDGSAWVSLTSAATAQISGAVATFATTQSITSTTYADVPGYTTAITVTNSNIINAQINLDARVDHTVQVTSIKLVRVVSGTPTDLFIDESNITAGLDTTTNFNIVYADTHGQPSGTVITYKLMAKVDAGILTINPHGTNAQIFAYEITTSPVSVSSVNGATGTVVLDTDDIAEGSNLYYTTARWDTKMAAADTDDLSQGSTNLYHQSDLGSLT